jgi:hypothetical protein
MIKGILGVLLILVALGCIGATVYSYLAGGGDTPLWSVDVVGAFVFHAVAMAAAMFLVAQPAKKKD